MIVSIKYELSKSLTKYCYNVKGSI